MNEKTNFELKRELISRIFQKYKDDNIQIGKLAKQLIYQQNTQEDYEKNLSKIICSFIS